MSQSNELHIDLLGASSMNPFKRNNSSSREVMLTTHLGQVPTVSGSEPRRIFTGAEAEYGRFTFAIKFPVDCKVLRVLKKYQQGIGQDSIRANPVTYVIYEAFDDAMKTIGVLEIPTYGSYHKDFGFQLKKRPEVWDRIREGAFISKEEIIASSVALKDNGEYGIGVNAEMVALSIPSSIEDGFQVSRQFLERLEVKGYHTASVSCGKNYILLNTYGDANTYKTHPDIGERIREDGLVYALREVDEQESMMEVTPRSLRTINYDSDKLIYGEPGAKVVDITVFHDTNINKPRTIVGTTEQPRKYYNSQKQFCEELISTYRDLVKRRGKSLRTTPEFDQLVVEAQIFLPTPPNTRKLTRMNRLEKLDEWRIDLVYEYTLKPNRGEKLTSLDGGKGVFCRIVDESEMPIDENGNRAEVIIYGGSTMKRMNLGKAYEHFLNASMRDTIQRFRKELGLDPHRQHKFADVSRAITTKEKHEELANRLLGFYEIASPLQFEMFNNDDKFDHVIHSIAEGIYLYFPPDNPVSSVEMARKLMASEYCPHYGKVTYVNNVGERVQTVSNALIGQLYFILLEKTAREWSGVASVKLQYLGIVSKLNNNDKLSTYGREQPVRTLGEAEVRGWDATVGTEAVVDLLDQSNQPATHRHIVGQLLRTDEPANIERIVDRKLIPYGGSRPVAMVNNVLQSMGVKFVYRPD